jgi:hypothetical protein
MNTTDDRLAPIAIGSRVFKISTNEALPNVWKILIIGATYLTTQVEPAFVSRHLISNVILCLPSLLRSGMPEDYKSATAYDYGNKKNR